MVNFLFSRTNNFARLVGPSGELREHEAGTAEIPHANILYPLLDHLSLDKIQGLTITKHDRRAAIIANRSATCGLLCRMPDLHTLQLIQCYNPHFITILNPNSHFRQVVLCPGLRDLILYIEARDAFNIPELMSMARERATRGTKPLSITMIGLGELLPGKGVFRLREHVAHVEYRVEESPPKWDDSPYDANGALELHLSQQSRAYNLAQGRAHYRRLSILSMVRGWTG